MVVQSPAPSLSWVAELRKLAPQARGLPWNVPPGARPPACIPRAAGQPRLREWAGEVVGLLAWGMARVPAKPGIQGPDLKVSACCPFQSFDATSTPLSTLALLW